MKYWNDFSPAENARSAIITGRLSTKETPLIKTVAKAIINAVIAARNVLRRVLLLFPLESSKKPEN